MQRILFAILRMWAQLSHDNLCTPVTTNILRNVQSEEREVTADTFTVFKP